MEGMGGDEQKKSANHEELLQLAESHFQAHKYKEAEPILKQLVLSGHKRASIFHMLGTIYYDGGKFNKALLSFRRAIEIDPTLIDASVGLSIILNDLGQYKEGKKVFAEAQQRLRRQQAEDPQLNQELSIKHGELGQLYFKYGRYNEAIESFRKAMELSSEQLEWKMNICGVLYSERWS